MREKIIRFLQGIDAFLEKKAAVGELLDLYVIGKAALVLLYDFGRDGQVATRDVDVVQISWPPPPLLSLALEQFGKASSAVSSYGLYLEAVPSGLPPMPGAFRDRCQLIEGDWKVLRLHRLDAHDLAVSKFRRFARKDQEDVRQLCDKNLLNPDELTKALESAWIWTTDKDGDDDRDQAFASLRRVVAYLKGETRNL